METVAGFERVAGCGCGTVGVGVEQTISRIQDPDGEEQGKESAHGCRQAEASGKHGGPEDGDGGRVQREEVPVDEGGAQMA